VNLKRFDIYYLCVLSKPLSRQQICFQNQCFTMEKRWITIRVNCPRSWDVELCNHISKRLLHTGPEHVPHTNFYNGNVSFSSCLTGKFGIWFIYGVTCPQQIHL